MNSAEQIRVVVVDEHTLVRQGLRALLAPATEVNVVGDAADAREAIALVRQTQAQVLLVDRPAAGEDGTEVAAMVLATGMRTNLLLLTALSAPSALEALLHAGARGYLTRLAAESELLEAVRTVAGGSVYRCPLLATPWLAEPAAGSAAELDRRRFDRLTDREREVLVCTAHGFTAPEIGARLHISPKTVDTYKQRIHEKLGLQHRTDYVRLALRLHLMEIG
jgi:DNA-binding NarL/FixJ family response regulator